MYLGIRGKYEELPHHTIHIAEDYVGNLRAIEQDFTIPKSPSFYVQNASVTDPTLAPEGCSSLYVLVPVPHMHANVEWNEETRQDLRQTTLRQLARIGLEDVESRIVTERIITPKSWTEDFGLYRGATFNLAHSLDQMLHLRPHNRFEDLQDVYLVGGGTHPGSGLPVIYESSRITCRQLLARFGCDTRFIGAATPFPASSITQQEALSPAAT